MNETTPPHRFGIRGISWLTILLGLITLGTFIAIANPNVQYAVPMAINGGGVGYAHSTEAIAPTVPPQAAPAQNTSESASMPSRYYPSPYYNPDVPVTDTREFLKVNYNASMQTRDVSGLTRRVETTVRGYGGRVDSESSSPQYGYVSFAVPQSKYDDFRAELESLVGSRFLTVNISSQNLLPQKQSIEDQQKQADASLSDYQTARTKLVSAHASTVKSLQARIDDDAQQLVSLNAQQQSYDIQLQIQNVSYDETSLKQQLANENASYTSQLSNADANIKNAQDWQTAVKTQDQALMDNVATVSGSVSIQWISLWDMARLYLPGYWIPGIFALLTFLSYLYDRRRLHI